MDCIFCRIISGEVETSLLYADEACVAFLDINPATAGHTLVVPKQHADDLLGMSEPQARAVMSATWRVSRLLDQRLTPAGINVMQSNRTAAWQDVMHMHMHVHLVPRYDGDSVRRPWEGAPLQASAFVDLQERLRGQVPLPSVESRPYRSHVTDMFSGLHHVQLAIPEGSEAQAREFYGGVLGMVELDKPPVLAARGGCWFRSGGWEIHLGVERPFAPAKKAHPGVLVNDLDLLEQRLRSAGVEVERDDNFPGHRRFYSSDPYGNRLEFLEPHKQE